jgi:ParB family chromosome partitioning protein
MEHTRREPPKVVLIPLDQLVPHLMNPNVMAPELKEKLAANIRASGCYEPLITRRLPDGKHQILAGHQRAEVLRALGYTHAACLVWDVDDREALILLATLNRLRGEDVPAKRAALIAELEAYESLAELARLLPENETDLEATLQLLDFDVEGLIARLTEEADRAAAEGPQLFIFAVDAEEAPVVKAAVERAAATLSGSNRRGRALVVLSRKYLEKGS